jgi:hypothetical protein
VEQQQQLLLFGGLLRASAAVAAAAGWFNSTSTRAESAAATCCWFTSSGSNVKFNGMMHTTPAPDGVQCSCMLSHLICLSELEQRMRATLGALASFNEDERMLLLRWVTQFQHNDKQHVSLSMQRQLQ